MKTQQRLSNDARPFRTVLMTALVLVLAGPPAASAQHTVTLANGDRLTGSFAGIDGAVWKFDYLGQTQNIAVADIAAVTIDTPMGWRLADGTIVAGSLAATGSTGTLRLASGQTRTVALADLAAMGSPDDLDALVPIELGFFSPFGRFWGAVANLGISDKSGNSRARGWAAGIILERKTTRDRLMLRFRTSREETPDATTGDFVTTVSRYSSTLRGEVFASPDVFGFLQTRVERDRFQDLSVRSSNNLGLGFRPVANDQTDLRLSLSGGFEYESYVSATASKTNAIAVIGSNLTQRLGPGTLRWDLELTARPDDLSDYRFVSDAAVTMNLVAGLGFQFGVTNEYDNTPQPGIKKHDMLIATTLTYSLGR